MPQRGEGKNDRFKLSWDDLRAPATTISIFGFGTDPDFNSTKIGYDFDPATTETLYIIFQMPHTWKEGTGIRPHLHWLPSNTNTGNVLWRIEYKWTNVGDTESGSFTTLDSLDAADGVAEKHQVASFAEIDGSGKTLSSVLSIQLSRIGGDASDTYNADALLKEFDIHYQIDRIGSDNEFSNN